MILIFISLMVSLGVGKSQTDEVSLVCWPRLKFHEIILKKVDPNFADRFDQSGGPTQHASLYSLSLIFISILDPRSKKHDTTA